MSPPPFQALLDSHAAIVYRLLVAALGADRADDRFQDACIAALRAYPELASDADPRDWLLGLAGVEPVDEVAARPPAPAQRILDAIVERAERERLIDVAYCQADSPFGPLTVAATDRGLVALASPELPLDGLLERLAAEISPRVLEAPAQLEPIRHELDECFAGRRERFAQPIDPRLVRRDLFEAILPASAGVADA